jgi:hypothetical protein
MALFLGTVLLALGAQTFAYRTFFRLPGGNLFNIPGRFLFLASWSVPIVGMLGMARLMEKRPGDRRIDQILWTLLGLGILLIVFLATAHWKILWFAVIRPREVAGAAFMTANLAFFGTLSLGLLALYRRGKLKPWLFGILFILVFAGDLLHFSTRLKREYIGSDVIAPTPAIKKLQALTEEEGPFRVLGFQGNFSRQLSARETISMAMLVPKSANYYHLEDVQGYSPLHTLRYNEALQEAAGTVRGSATLRWLLVRDPTAPLLDLLGTKYILGEPHDRFLFGGEQILRGGESVIAKVTERLKEVRELLLVSCTDYSSQLPQGAKVADLIIRNGSGETRTVPLRAGIETADYRLAFPNVAKGHQPIRIFRSLPRVFSGELLATQVYLSRISFESISDPREVEFRSTLRDGVLVLFEASLSESGDGQFREVFEEDGIRLYENSGAFPRAWWVPNSVVVPPGKPGIDALVNGGFDLGATVLLEKEGAKSVTESTRKLGREDWTKPYAVRVVGHRAGRLDLEVDAPADGYVVAAEMGDFGWAALIDGKRAPKLRADGILMAVPVKSGKHTINLLFQPWDVYLGAALTFVSLVILISILRGRTLANLRRIRPESQ